jgi:hypothetical protein
MLAVTNNRKPILDTLMKEAIRISESMVLTNATRRYIPEDGIPHIYRRENFKSYIALTAELCSGDVMCLL